MIHFDDWTISYGATKETLCGLDHTFVFKDTKDEIYVLPANANKVSCRYCISRLARCGMIPYNYNRLLMLGI